MSEVMNEGSRLRRFLRETAVLGLLAVGIMAGRSALADHYYVPSGSMEYTLIPGDRVFVDKRAYGLRIPFTNIELAQGDPVRRGDIVIFDSPRDDVRLIKRIVAVGGDAIGSECHSLAPAAAHETELAPMMHDAIRETVVTRRR